MTTSRIRSISSVWHCFQKKNKSKIRIKYSGNESMIRRMIEKMQDCILKKYGMTDRFLQEAALFEGLFLARITEQHHDIYKVISEQGELQAGVSGKFAYDANNDTDFPAVGDWVMIDRVNGSGGNAVIHQILSRKSVFVRKAAGTGNAVQIIAANVDVIFICMSLNADFNMRRLERYLSIAWDSMATPVIVLTKSDLCDDLEQKLADVNAVSVGSDVIICSSMAENGYQSVTGYITEGRTIAFLGSSGVGKTTLINRLLGEDILATKAIREDDGKGRHTTTRRQLLLLPAGGIVIDTPGMRELHLSTGDLSKSFEDIDELASHCKYRDCSHNAEPGCAVRAAIAAGELSAKRFENYRKLQNELSYEGLNFRQMEEEKIKRMFGSKSEMKQAMRIAKNKNK